MTLPVRRRVAGGSSRRARRARIPVNWARVLGGLAIAGSIVAGQWLLSDPQFELDQSRIQVSGVLHTDPAVVRARLDLPADGAANVFGLRTSAMERALVALPAVDAATVRAVLPDALLVTVTERTPVFVWSTDGGEFLVDATGVIVASDDDAATGVTELPQVRDRRALGASPEPGQTIDSIDLDAMLRLAAVTPELLGSGADGLELAVDDDEGFAIRALPDGWRAVFGHYTATLRTTEMIDGQVQCLRSILARGEEAVETVYLSLGDDRCGTFVPSATPSGRRGPGAGETAPDDASPTPEE